MAVGAVLPLFSVMLTQIDMDSCLGLSPGLLQNNLCLAQRAVVTQVPSASSSTMVNPTQQEREDSELSQSAPGPASPQLLPPPSPAPTSTQQQQAGHDSTGAAAFPVPEDAAARAAAARAVGSPASSERNPNPANPAAALESQASEEGETPAASGEQKARPKKRARSSAADDDEESVAVERSHSQQQRQQRQQQQQQQPADTGPSISLGRSPSDRDTGASQPRSQSESRPWWLTAAPPATPAASSFQPSSVDTGSAGTSLPTATHHLKQQQQQQQQEQEQQQQQLLQLQQQLQLQQFQQLQQEQQLRQQQQQLQQQQLLQQQQQQQQQRQLEQLQQQAQRQQREREFFPTQPPVYHPDMLSSMESSHDRAGGATPAEVGSTRDWPERSYLPPRHDTPELPFFTRRDSPGQRSSSAASAHSGEEGPPRPASSGHSKGKEPAIFDTLGHGGAHMAELGHKGMLPVRHPSPLVVEAQPRFPAPLQGSPFLGAGQGQPGFATPGVNPSFYPRFLPPVPSDTPPMFIPPPVTLGRSLSGSIPGQRPLGHMEMVPPPLMQPPNNDLAMQKLAATAAAAAAAPAPFLPRFQPADAARLGFPYSTYDVMQAQAQAAQQRPQQLPVVRPGLRGPPPGVVPPFDMRHAGSGHLLPPFTFPPDPQRPLPQLPLPGPSAAAAAAAGGFQHLLPPSQAPSAYGRPGGLNWSHLPGTDIAADTHHLERTANRDAVRVPLVAAPTVVVLEGRDLGWRINLQEFNSYESFATQLRAMFYSSVLSAEDIRASGVTYDLTTAIPGYQITYEDEEGDTLLAGDTSWRQFIRLAKRIKILPFKRRPARPAGPL